MTLSFPSSPPSDVLPAEEPNRGSLPLPLSVPDPHGWGVYGAVLLFAQRVRKSDSAVTNTPVSNNYPLPPSWSPKDGKQTF